jgi:hypothetical protein
MIRQVQEGVMSLAERGVEVWPALPYSEWGDCCQTLQMWLQIVGKIRMALTPHINQSWNVTLYPTARGLTTSSMWYGTRALEIDFDFLKHELQIVTEEGEQRTIVLMPTTVKAFYGEVMGAMESLKMPVKVYPVPSEVQEPIPFDQDETHKAYDREHVERYWRVLLQAKRVMMAFRSQFIGKVSPVHLFWGAMDLACTRFSGRTAPPHPSMPGLPDRVTRDAYSHEVSSCGFWPGAPGVDAFFYSYAYPEPKGYREYKVGPAEARFDETFGEFILPYEAMRRSKDPDAALMEFLESTYEAAANTGAWDRKALEQAAGS